MRFTIQNLGRLEEATIDLGKDLIVLTGPNNTSKTYVAHAIYGFCHYLDALLDGPMRNALRPPKDAYIEYDLLATVERDLGDIRGLMAKGYTDKLPEVLAASHSFTERARIDLRLDDEEIEKGKSKILGQVLHTRELSGRILIDKSSGSGIWTATRMAPAGTRSSEEQIELSWRNFLFFNVVLAFEHALFNGLTSPWILTSERSAVEVFSRELAAQRLDPLGQNVPPPDYPLALAESLKAAQQMASAKNRTSLYAVEADRLEREILEGRLEIGPYSEMHFVPTGTTQQLDMNLSSSSVKSLASLSFYLRHQANEGDFLIIDEPELNLHPANQRKVARLLARLARNGIKVLISTHSDYIIRELNNLIMLSADKEGDLLRQYGYDEGETLSPERVGAYMFDGAHGHALPIEPAGIAVTAIDDVIREQNRSSRDIYSSLFDRDDP